MDFSKNAPRGEERGIHHIRSDEMSFSSALILSFNFSCAHLDRSRNRHEGRKYAKAL